MRYIAARERQSRDAALADERNRERAAVTPAEMHRACAAGAAFVARRKLARATERSSRTNGLADRVAVRRRGGKNVADGSSSISTSITSPVRDAQHAKPALRHHVERITERAFERNFFAAPELAHTQPKRQNSCLVGASIASRNVIGPTISRSRGTVHANVSRPLRTLNDAVVPVDAASSPSVPPACSESVNGAASGSGHPVDAIVRCTVRRVSCTAIDTRGVSSKSVVFLFEEVIEEARLQLDAFPARNTSPTSVRDACAATSSPNPCPYSP